MAITTTTITKAAGWARTDVIDQLEEAFTWLGLHGTQISGLVTSVTMSFSDGGTVGSANTDYYDVPMETTTGIGTGLTVIVDRNGGSLNRVIVDRPGYGFTDGEFVTISAEDIGGSANGAAGIGLTVSVAGGATPVGYGSTNAWFDKNLSSNPPWAILKQDFDTSKKYGVTYRGFRVANDYELDFLVGSSFQPWDDNNTSNGKIYYGNSFRGTPYLDIPNFFNSTASSLNYNNNYYQFGNYRNAFVYATTNSPTSHDLKLNVYRSSIDPSFAVLSYNQPSVSGSITDSTFSTFIIHNFDSDLWDYDEVFSAGVTLINRDPVSNSAAATNILSFATAIGGNYDEANARYLSTRTAEYGWGTQWGDIYGNNFRIYNIESTSGSNSNSQTDSTVAFSDYNAGLAGIFTRVGGSKDKGTISNEFSNRDPITIYSSVIKGIPINGNLIPCPYYIPDDFVLIDFQLDASSQNILQGDTITISGSEVYTVITGTYNQSGETSGILFCARTV